VVVEYKQVGRTSLYPSLIFWLYPHLIFWLDLTTTRATDHHQPPRARRAVMCVLENFTENACLAIQKNHYTAGLCPSCVCRLLSPTSKTGFWHGRSGNREGRKTKKKSDGNAVLFALGACNLNWPGGAAGPELGVGLWESATRSLLGCSQVWAGCNSVSTMSY
jgi:hypothetical protein